MIVPPAASTTSSGLLSPGAVPTTINSAIVAGDLTVSGTGTLDLPTANNFSGTTFLAGSPISIPSTVGGTLAGAIAGGGTLVVGTNGSLGTSTLDLVGGTIESSDAVTLGNAVALGGSAIIGGYNNLTFSGPGSVSSNSTLNVLNSGLTTFSGALSGSGSLTVIGTGNLVLSGPSTFSGGTTVAADGLVNSSLESYTPTTFNSSNTVPAGIIVAGNSTTSGSSVTSGPLGTGALTLVSGALQADASVRTVPNAVVLNGNITLAPTGLGGNSSGGSGLTLSGPVTVTGNSTVTVNSGGLGDTFSGNIGGAGQLTIAGLGALTLAGASDTYLGGTVLAMSDGEVGVEASQGTLTVANGSDLGSGRLTLTSGTLLATLRSLLQTRSPSRPTAMLPSAAARLLSRGRAGPCRGRQTSSSIPTPPLAAGSATGPAPAIWTCSREPARSSSRRPIPTPAAPQSTAAHWSSEPVGHWLAAPSQ